MRRGGPHKLSAKPASKISLITEYFGHTPGKRGRMEDVWDGECSDQEEFIGLSLQYVGVREQRPRVKSPPSHLNLVERAMPRRWWRKRMRSGWELRRISWTLSEIQPSSME